MLRNIRLLYIHNFLTDFWPQWPYLVIYFVPIAGSYTLAMSVMAVETLTAALLDVPTGIFSDRIGRRVTLACGSLFAALGTLCYAAAHDMKLLYGGALCWGLSQCLFSGNNNALLYESLKSAGLEQRFHHYRGSTGSMFQLALCLSALAAIPLSHYGLRFIFLVAALPQIVAFGVSFLFEEPRVHIESRIKTYRFSRRPFLMCCATRAFCSDRRASRQLWRGRGALQVPERLRQPVMADLGGGALPRLQPRLEFHRFPHGRAAQPF